MPRQPRTSRPFMPEYGLLPEDQGKGLFDWSWAERKLTQSHNYWLSTVTPAGVPHCMPVWAIWRDDSAYLSTAGKKAANLGARGPCVLATDDAEAPIIVEGNAQLVNDLEDLDTVLAIYTEKYGMAYPDDSRVFRVRPGKVFAFVENPRDFLGTATRWVFES